MNASRTGSALLAVDEPEGLTPRGTLVVLGGRGESAEVYRRFAERLASDAYRVRVLAGTDIDVAEMALILTEAVAPRVVIGTDTGALRAAQLIRDGDVDVQGLILAGLPTESHHLAIGDWEAELDLRTGCPVHRRRLSSGIVQPGALASEVPSELSRRPSSDGLPLPVLALHGEADEVSSASAARAWLRDVRQREFVTVRGGRHDVLNDLNHRSVAAMVVLWLERLRSGLSTDELIMVGAAGE